MLVRNLVSTVMALFAAAMLVLVGGRFSALLADANRSSDIVERLYRHSDFWVKPFFGMFDLSNHAVDGGGVFEPASLLALVVYVAGGLLVAAIICGATIRHSDDA